MPAAVLFGRVWQENSHKSRQIDLEKNGVEYITALSPLVSALAESESSALQGVKEPPASLATAVARVAAVDARLGEDLRTKERWADLSGKIAKLAKVTGGTLPVMQAHIEVTDLTLALYAAVQRNSELNRDPDSDVSNLQQAVAADMPDVVVRVSRMGDWANLLQTATGITRGQIGIQFGQEVLAVQDSVNRLTDDLQAAVDDTSSPTLSGSLVSTLDSFRRGVESMTRGANPGGAPNVATMSTAQTALQGSLTALAGVIIKEMDKLLDDRSDSLAYRQVEALAAGLLVVVLVLAAVVWPAFVRRREPAYGVGESTRDIPGRPMSGPGYGGSPYDRPPNYGDIDPTRRERSGALR